MSSSGSTTWSPLFYLMAAPPPASRSKVQDVVDDKIRDFASSFPFVLPELKVGTLDTLMQLSDDITKMDVFAESLVGKLATTLLTLFDRDEEKVRSSLAANSAPLDQYLQKFQWDAAKYAVKNNVRELVDTISKNMSQIDLELKNKLTDYNTLRTNVANIERKQTGNLLSRNLGDLVSKDNFVLDSEYLTTLLVVIPKYMYKDWNSMYETGLANYVVPRSSSLIYEDSDYGLFNVTLFKRSVDEFKQKARENRFIVRDFEFKESDIEDEKKERAELGNKLKKQLANLQRWCKTTFDEAFCSWIHLKALRLHIESVLRYGLPVNYQALVIKPKPKYEKKTRDLLIQLFGHLGGIGGIDTPAEEMAAAPGQEYYPFVFFNINLDLIK